MMMKITEIIKDVQHISYSFEVTPDITEEELNNLHLKPLFFSITWHAETHQCVNLEIAPLKLANYLRNKSNNILLHITCTNMRRDYVNMLLTALQDKGICNLFIILGEKFDPSKSDFKSSQELIFYIRERTGNYFCIGVAGFPNCDDKISHLKAKVDSGADFILTQAIFEHKNYERFVIKCREVGIDVPIIPGLFPFETKGELEGFSELCKVRVTNYLMEVLENISGIEVVARLINDLVEQLHVKHFHIFTLNKLPRTAKLIDKINSTIK
ncbi:5,10-methylenetetrahydrofolate reductase [Nymphalis io]|uniref:5,10-methylenetetrahydrofolate reductase n=1 Tax=Inachis io TaxID=171585 RepID=UPI002168635B|nr:5,10-methylenetetrahydrofolate reductase [Nymphalis io]